MQTQMETEDTIKVQGMTDLTREQSAELFNLYHLARSAGKQSRYDRMIYASKHFSEAHPEVSSTCAYKHLDRSF